MKKLLVIIAVLSVHMSSAFIYEVKMLRKWDAARNRYHYFIGYSDFHDKKHEANKQQLATIKQVLASCDNQDTAVFLEDLSSPAADGRVGCGDFYVNSRGGVLGGLTQVCKNMKLTTDNIEYRYCRVASLGPVLNNLEQSPRNFNSVREISVGQLGQEVDREIDAIASYDDGPALNALYQEKLRTVAHEREKLVLNADSTHSVADYVEQSSDSAGRLSFLMDAFTFDSELLDFKLVHGILHATDKSRVVAFAGGAHISRASDLLQKYAGYELVYETDVEFANEYDLQRCLGSNIIEGKYCVRPTPLNINLFSKIIRD